MNLLLLIPEDFISANIVRLSDHRFEHLLKVKKLSLKDTLQAGLINNKTGYARVININIDNGKIDLEISLTENPVDPLDVHLILALPRPKMLKRILQTISSMGVKQLSLEQAKDTRLPIVNLNPL